MFVKVEDLGATELITLQLPKQLPETNWLIADREDMPIVFASSLSDAVIWIGRRRPGKSLSIVGNEHGYKCNTFQIIPLKGTE